MRLIYQKGGNRTLSIIKYLLSIFMMVAGVLTGIGPLIPMEGALGFLYSTRISLIMFGLVFFTSGATLFLGKIKKNKRLVGMGLMMIYMCFVFAALLNAIVGVSWIPNLIISVFIGLLYLRWKYKVSYVDDPDHFKPNR